LDRPGDRLIGRDIEFKRLTQALDELGSRGTAVAVIGEPGIGKTALLAENVSNLCRVYCLLIPFRLSGNLSAGRRW
jgi:ATP-dependent Clp protease ATP-binding subunit ClpA